MAFWWVNHKQTRDQEVQGGYLWSPMRNANGAFNQTYENMRLVRPGDVVFSYAHGRIGAMGQVIETATRSPKPTEFGSVGDYWSNEGWLVGVYFNAVPMPLSPKAQIDHLRDFLPTKYSPIQRNGDGNQGCYLASISDALGYIILGMLGMEKPTLAKQPSVAGPNRRVLDDLNEIADSEALTETQRLQLAKARVGQGLFRSRVMLVDPRCRVTGVDDPRLLIASHIKPWRDSDNSERVNGFNGFMLSPHIDALFDERLITFEDDGRMLINPSLSRSVLDLWSISAKNAIGTFRSEQLPFLAHHRKAFAMTVSNA